MKTRIALRRFSSSILVFVLGGLGVLGHPIDAWHVRHSGFDTLNGVTYGAGLFVAVGGNGTLPTSPTGESWTPQNNGTNASLNDVTRGNGAFVVVALACLTSSGCAIPHIDKNSSTVEGRVT